MVYNSNLSHDNYKLNIFLSILVIEQLYIFFEVIYPKKRSFFFKNVICYIVFKCIDLLGDRL